MRRPAAMVLRFGLTVAAIMVAVGAVVTVLTNPDPQALSTRLQARPVASSGQPAPAATPPQAAVPLYSDDWFDDSGYSFATAFTGNIADTRSLEQLRAACERRGYRGVEHLETQLAAFSKGGTDPAAHVARL